MDASAEVLASGSPLGPADPISLGRYTMLRRLGEGGMGAVYLARGPGDRLVAVKVIRPEYAQIDEFRVRFRRETDNARRVARFCTAEVLEAEPDGEKPYLVTEFVEGATLSQVIAASGPLSAANLERLAVGVAAALSAIHGAGVLHRDLKPSNVMLSPYGPRVIDFGIARAADAAIGLTEVRIGTPAFMAPEQVLGDPLTAAVDIFAWGAVVAYASTGNYPFGNTTEAQFYRIVQAPPDLSGLDPNGFLRPIVERAMNKNPSARPSATELLLSLLSATNASAPDNTEVAVTQALTGWNQPGPGPAATAATAQTPWYTDGMHGSTRPGTKPDRGGDPYPATGLAGQPPGPPVAPASGYSGPPGGYPGPPGAPVSGWYPGPPGAPVSGWYPESAGVPAGGYLDHPSSPGRPPTGPPVRPIDPMPAPGASGPGRQPHPGRLIAIVAVVAVVLAAAIFAGVTLASDSKSGRSTAGSRATSASRSSVPTGSSATKAGAGSFPIPRSARPLPADTLVFTSVSGTNHSLYTMRSDGADVQPVGTGTPKDLSAISPDRRTIAYFVTSTTSLWMMAADGTGTRSTLKGPATVLKPYGGDRTAWSPDGQSVAFVASGPNGDGLYVVALTTGAFRKLPTQSRTGQPYWSPAGDQIVYWSNTVTTSGPLYTIAADGKSPPHQLTSAADSEPVWSPDASHITFQRRSTTSGPDIWTMRADGTDPTNLTPGAGKDVDKNPSYSPTGAIVFSSNRSGEDRLYIIEPGAEAQLIPNQTLPAINPCWSQGRP